MKSQFLAEEEGGSFTIARREATTSSTNEGVEETGSLGVRCKRLATVRVGSEVRGFFPYQVSVSSRVLMCADFSSATVSGSGR